jgi:hypothetical protein
LIDVYNCLSKRLQSSDFLKSFRGRKPRKLDSTISRQIDENYKDTHETTDQSQTSDNVTEVRGKYPLL